MSAVRHWPATMPPGPGERVETRCPECRTQWHVHVDMAGFKLRCECGSWVPIPDIPRVSLASPAHRVALAAAPRREMSPRTPRALAGYDANRAPASISSSEAAAPGEVMEADLKTRNAWTTRSLLELIAVMAALIGPSLIVFLKYEGSEAMAAMPIASLVSGILVLMVCATMGSYSFSGLRDSKPYYFLEALFVAAGCAGLAIVYSQWIESIAGGHDPFFSDLRETVGIGLTLFVVGLCPAIFEELAFRGLMQARLRALLGAGAGLAVTAAAFALAHGWTLGLPFQFAVGYYLCHLRERSGSLYPCMLMHLVYNSTLVLILV